MVLLLGFLFFKQKTAYEMRISDWSSDVCSSDLKRPGRAARLEIHAAPPDAEQADAHHILQAFGHPRPGEREIDRARHHHQRRGKLARAKDIALFPRFPFALLGRGDRKSTRLNSRH